MSATYTCDRCRTKIPPGERIALKPKPAKARREIDLCPGCSRALDEFLGPPAARPADQPTPRPRRKRDDGKQLPPPAPTA